MTLAQKIAWDDTILPFQLDHADVRGRVVRLDGTLDEILGQHSYPPAIESLVAEAAILTALIGQTLKLRWRLSLQIRGTGPVKLLATDYFAPSADGETARIRAFASFDETDDADLSNVDTAFDLLRGGVFGIVIDQGPGMTPYQGITPLTGSSLAECAATYFAQSEQLPTRFALSFGRATEPGQSEAWRGGGVLIQHMPKASPHAAQDAPSGADGLLAAEDLVQGDDAENWGRANVLLDTVDDLELIGPHISPTDLLTRLFHEERPRVFPSQPVGFGCTCSADKVRDSLAAYDTADLTDMITDDGIVTADCQFCGKHYELDPETLGRDAKDRDADADQ